MPRAKRLPLFSEEGLGVVRGDGALVADATTPSPSSERRGVVLVRRGSLGERAAGV
jgi:hypothetical protein